MILGSFNVLVDIARAEAYVLDLSRNGHLKLCQGMELHVGKADAGHGDRWANNLSCLA